MGFPTTLGKSRLTMYVAFNSFVYLYQIIFKLTVSYPQLVLLHLVSKRISTLETCFNSVSNAQYVVQRLYGFPLLSLSQQINCILQNFYFILLFWCILYSSNSSHTLGLLLKSLQGVWISISQAIFNHRKPGECSLTLLIMNGCFKNILSCLAQVWQYSLGLS